MPKRKGSLNNIYISERLQESLRPIVGCAMTTVVAPMGYGKTTAVNWYLSKRAAAVQSSPTSRYPAFCIPVRAGFRQFISISAHLPSMASCRIKALIST